jgi:hypothetical protein
MKFFYKKNGVIVCKPSVKDSLQNHEITKYIIDHYDPIKTMSQYLYSFYISKQITY